MKSFTTTLLFSASIAPLAGAGTITVDPSGSVESIAEAVALATAGDTIRIVAGTYFENPRIPAGKNGLRIEGVGNVIIDATPLGGTAAGAGIVIDSNSVTLENLTVRNARGNFQLPGAQEADGTAIVVRANGFVARDVHVATTSDEGVVIIGSNILLERCSIRDTDFGLRISGGSNAVFRECTFQQVGEYGALFDDYSNLEVVDCVFRLIEDGSGLASDGDGSNSNIHVHDCSFDLADSGGIEIDATDLLVENNTFTTVGTGVDASGSNVVVRNNVFTGMRREAIELKKVTGGTVENNSIRGFLEFGMTLSADTSAVTIRDNSLRDGFTNEGAAILVDGTGHVIDDNKVKDVQGDGFRIKCDSSTITNNSVKRAGRDGFDLEGAILAIVDSNTATECRGEGLEHGGIFATITNNTLTKNRIDLAGFGTLNGEGNNTFATGGFGVAPEIE